MGMLRKLKEAAAAQHDSAANSFVGSTPETEIETLEVGDKFTIPSDFTGEVMTDKRFTRDPKRPVQYIFINCGTDAAENWKKLYTSTFTKSVPVYGKKEDGTLERLSEPRVVCSGTAAELFRSKGSLNESMTALAGKTLEIKDSKEVTTRNFRGDDLTTRTVLTIDIVA